MLLVRAQWVKLDIPILVVIQRFCSRGGKAHRYIHMTEDTSKSIVRLSPYLLPRCEKPSGRNFVERTTAWDW